MFARSDLSFRELGGRSTDCPTIFDVKSTMTARWLAEMHSLGRRLIIFQFRVTWPRRLDDCRHAQTCPDVPAVVSSTQARHTFGRSNNSRQQRQQADPDSIPFRNWGLAGIRTALVYLWQKSFESADMLRCVIISGFRDDDFLHYIR